MLQHWLALISDLLSATLAFGSHTVFRCHKTHTSLFKTLLHPFRVHFRLHVRPSCPGDQFKALSSLLPLSSSLTWLWTHWWSSCELNIPVPHYCNHPSVWLEHSIDLACHDPLYHLIIYWNITSTEKSLLVTICNKLPFPSPRFTIWEYQVGCYTF